MRVFPKRSMCFSAEFGKAMATERKMLSSESVDLSKKAKGEKRL